MTIQVEREALLRVLERPIQHSQVNLQSLPPLQGDEYLLVDFRDTFSTEDCGLVGKLRSPTFDDEDSIFTLSTASLSDTEEVLERNVSFADDLITEEWTRPFTPKEEVSKLFYSTEETQR